MGLFFVIVALFFIANIIKNKRLYTTSIKQNKLHSISLLRNNKLEVRFFITFFFINKTYKQQIILGFMSFIMGNKK